MLKCAEHVSGWEVRDMSEPLLLRALGTNDGATDVLIVSDVVFAEQLASVSRVSAVHTHARTHVCYRNGWMG